MHDMIRRQEPFIRLNTEMAMFFCKVARAKSCAVLISQNVQRINKMSETHSNFKFLPFLLRIGDLLKRTYLSVKQNETQKCYLLAILCMLI